MSEPEACSGCDCKGRKCDDLPAPAIKCCPDCDHDAGLRYVEAIRGARAMRERAVDLIESGCVGDDDCLLGPVRFFTGARRHRAGAHQREVERGIPEGWITR